MRCCRPWTLRIWTPHCLLQPSGLKPLPQGQGMPPFLKCRYPRQTTTPPPPAESPTVMDGGSLEDLPPEVLRAMASIPADSPDNFGPLPNTDSGPTPERNITPGPVTDFPGPTENPQGAAPVAVAPPIVPIEPGDFIPPPSDASCRRPRCQLCWIGTPPRGG